LGQYLATVVRCPVEGGRYAYKVWGFSSFDDYCERELGFRRKKAQHLVNIYQKTSSGAIPKGAAEKIDWSKMAMIVPLVDKGVIDATNVEKWMADIEGKSFAEVRGMTKLAVEKSKQKSQASSSSASTTVSPEEVYILRIPLYKGQWENVQVALKKAEAISGSDKTPHQLDCIALSFNSEGFTTRSDSLDEICRRAERVFGVSLIAIDTDDGNKVVFGDSLAAMLLATESGEKTGPA